MNPLNALLGIFSHDIGIDLGTANTLVTVRGRGIVIDEPSVVAIDKVSKKILAIGAEAKRMVGRTPANIIAVRPLKDGVISDFEVTERMLHYFIRSVHDHFGFGNPRPRVVLGIPSGVTEVEKRAVHDAAINAGARAAFLVEEPMAAAIGSGLPVMEPNGCMIVDIGGGTTEVAVIALGGIVVSTSIRVAGDEMDQEIIAYARQVHNMLIGERMAEEIKIRAGSAFPLEEEENIDIRGRDLATGLPKSVEVSTVELRDALSGSIGAIVEAVRSTIEIKKVLKIPFIMMSHGQHSKIGRVVCPMLGSMLAFCTQPVSPAGIFPLQPPIRVQKAAWENVEWSVTKPPEEQRWL